MLNISEGLKKGRVVELAGVWNLAVWLKPWGQLLTREGFPRYGGIPQDLSSQRWFSAVL